MRVVTILNNRAGGASFINLSPLSRLTGTTLEHIPLMAVLVIYCSVQHYFGPPSKW